MRHTNGQTAVVDELQFNHPGIFGSQGGYSRCYSLSNVSFTMGFLVGPFCQELWPMPWDIIG